jgi:ATP-dependent DNA helicase RecQ
LLLRHFGEDPPQSCGNCDNCLEAPGIVDATTLAQKLLSAVYRTGQSFGFGHIEKVLTGQANDERITQRGHDQLSVFGIVGRGGALLRPLSRGRFKARGSLMTDRAWRADAGRRCADVLKAMQRADRAGTPKAERSRKPRRERAPATRSTRSAIRCSKRCGRCAAISPQRRACRPM